MGTGMPKPFFSQAPASGAHRSRAQRQQDLGGSPSGTFTGILQGNCLPAANRDVLTGTQSQTSASSAAQRPSAAAPRLGRPAKGAGTLTCTCTAVLGPSSCGEPGRGWGGTEHPQPAPLLRSSLGASSGERVGSAPVDQPQTLPPSGGSGSLCLMWCEAELTLACSPLGDTPRTPAPLPGAKAEARQATECCQDQSNSPPNGWKV